MSLTVTGLAMTASLAPHSAADQMVSLSRRRRDRLRAASDRFPTTD
jgi:hypothetical protein